MPKPVLIVSTVIDPATDAVEQIFCRSGIPYVRLNTEDLPFENRLSYVLDNESIGPRIFSHTSAAGTTAVGDSHSIWYRRMRAPAVPEGMDPGVYDFCIRESRSSLIGSVLSRSGRVMSSPEAIWKAEFKPFQLTVAKASGFLLPKTLVSNDPDTIRRFYSSVATGLIIKPVRTGYVEYQGQPRSIYTNRFLDEHIERIEEARIAPSIYQEFINKTADIRVTYVGGRIFCAAIHSQTDECAQVDWRRTSDPNLPHTVHQLPPDLTGVIHSFMNVLNLEFGALDFALSAEGQYYFLEVNPNGQWMWLDRILEFGISDAVAEWLTA
jgi:glutathione synthase/RimK-type ligase-like ATP-grasp enzyme